MILTSKEIKYIQSRRKFLNRRHLPLDWDHEKREHNENVYLLLNFEDESNIDLELLSEGLTFANTTVKVNSHDPIHSHSPFDIV